MVQYKKFDNGLKLIVNKIEGLLSVTTGVIVKAGSVFENDLDNGISHFIEHMLFKGTTKRNSFEISDSIDRIGAQINAFTSKEMTCYYTKSTEEHIEKSIDILSDILFNSTFVEDELNRERGVILEEINMVEDSPEDLCLDLLAKAHYGDEGLGRTILGSKENIERFGKSDILKYMDKRYTSSDIVISISGNIDIKQAENLVEKYFATKFKENTSKKVEANEVVNNKYKFISKSKKIEQAHLAFAFPSFEFNNVKNNIMSVANAVLGGGMSSRLFQEVREKNGLAYSVYSYSSSYADSGYTSVYAGVNPSKIEFSAKTILQVIDNVKKEGITKDEFERGKEQLKGAFILGQESTSSQMMLYGKYLLFANDIFDFNARIKEINAITLDEVNDVLKTQFDFDKMSASLVAKDCKKIDLLKLL